MKVFLVGMPKSGTSTFHKALHASGYQPVHWVTGNQRRIGRLMYERLYDGLDPLSDLRKYDAVTQADFISFSESYWPQMDPIMLSAIRRYHPNCIFVLNMRDPLETADSITRWNDLQKRLIKMGAPGLPGWAAASKSNLARWVAAHHNFCREWFADDPLFFEYRIDDPAAPEKIGHALGQDIRWWGTANVNSI